jgi:hypothetical protein
VLDALGRAAADRRAGDRRQVLRLFFSGGPHDTVAGPLGVLASGEASPARFTAFRLAGGRREYLRP